MQSRRVGFIFGLAAISALLLAIFFTNKSDQGGSTLRAVGRPNQVLPGGDRTSLAQAIAKSSVPVFRPQTSEASDGSIRDVWIRVLEEPEVYIRYESALAVIVRPASTGQPTAEYAKAQIADGVPGEVQKIGPYDAFIVPEDNGPSLGSVRFLIDDAIVTVIGNGDVPTATLADVASSIVKNAAAAKAEVQAA